MTTGRTPCLPGGAQGHHARVDRACPHSEATTRERLRSELSAVVDDESYPCLGARSVLHRDGLVVASLAELGTAATAVELIGQLRAFSAGVDDERGFASFVAGFDSPRIESEEQFERLLWQQLQQVHDVDPDGWSREVSDDPADPRFAFSAAGAAYFVVGLHPKASRLARRFPRPVLVFNLHAQFDTLRTSGRFIRMRDAIRRRDEKLQGSLNPMVGDHGQVSEARQYSGRAVGGGWRAPFTPRRQPSFTV